MAEEDKTNALPIDEEEPLFDVNLKKKKKKKAVAFDDFENEGTGEKAPIQDAVPIASILKTSEEIKSNSVNDLDFSDLKRKKKKKAITIDLDEEVNNDNESSEKNINISNEESAAAAEEFADLKKKKKNKKKAFDLEAFERELAEVEGINPTSDKSNRNKLGEEDNEDQINDNDGLFNNNNQEKLDEEENSKKTKSQIAAEKKAWLKETDRDYTYDELLGRFYQSLYLSHPSLSIGGTKKRYTLAPPSVHREGNKRSIWANVNEICKKMHRGHEHVIQFLFAELGTSGSVDGNGNLVIKGRFQQKQIENVLRRYIVEYVTCKTCKSPDTLLQKDNRLYFVACESCGSKRSVSAIKTGFSAQIGKRKAQRSG
ncbi:hypothetical protein CROQUDRAFT_76446 [Cronartium quercuum f. sp. fusiforme G11]|uniref:Translation initiation factor IF2/IF5 domain-containing protein n=1 Tax=Cronartium quercuum f. sp. fusiforme G11 TaxID=708437 RepID=A0A9P6TCQ5_9BASI|nr:hypothetical protein CROQUDRAFT_76446 [Cronartium quercuum f. sp. fusiforme G11]